jgi:hypothetical protein
VRPFWALAILLAAVLAGCASGGGKADTSATKADFTDLGVTGSATTGVILGVVVDDAIRPVKDVKVELRAPDGGNQSKATDAQGRFAFGDLQPGTYFLRFSNPQFAPVQTTVAVQAGDLDPPTTRVQMQRLFSQQPYTEQIKWSGYIQCGYSGVVGSTCVNDYTRLVPQCNGGCLKQYNVSKAAGNDREYTTSVGPGWQVIVMEAYWTPTTEESGQQLFMSVSYLNRTSTSHYYGGLGGPSPLRLEFDVGQAAEGQNGDPKLIPPEGMGNLFVFYNSDGVGVAVNQPFQHFQTNFYYGLPPEGWSVVNGDPLPF